MLRKHSEVHYTDLSEATRECDLFLQYTAAQSQSFIEPFMTAASPPCETLRTFVYYTCIFASR